MATARTFIHAAPEDIFNVLSNADAYEHWVVGCQEVRDHDAAFPEPGSSFEHRLGIGPLRIQDITTVVDCVPPRRLVLRTKAWPLGETVVEMRLTPARGGTTVEMRQQPAAGPIAGLDNPLQQFFTSLRDRECLRRLRRLAERQ
jgi:uncharacterized protein YndB with AHSA1/START domain